MMAKEIGPREKQLREMREQRFAREQRFVAAQQALDRAVQREAKKQPVKRAKKGRGRR